MTRKDRQTDRPIDDAAEFRQQLRRGTTLLHHGKASEAIPLLERAHALQPADVDAALNLGGAYILTKQWRRARAVLEPLSERAPDNAMVWINLGAAYLGNPILARDEEQRRAIAAFERALEINPAAPSVAYNLGLIHRDRNDIDQALHWFDQAVRHNPQDRDARSMLEKMRARQAGDSDG